MSSESKSASFSTECYGFITRSRMNCGVVAAFAVHVSVAVPLPLFTCPRRAPRAPARLRLPAC